MKEKKGAERLFQEIIAKNFPNLGKELDIQVHGAKRSSYYLSAKRRPPKHIKMILSKVNNKERILKAAREKRK